jgi:lipid-A-disaccharide synthase-like uncharacterized protein
MSDILSYVPVAFWIMVAVGMFVCGGLVFYALRTKGDVSARLSHGLTSFELQAKERPNQKRL